jgi:hypothetical protein
MGRRANLEQLGSWIQHEWVPILGYNLTFHILSRGWLGFLFNFKEKSMFILRGTWFMDSFIHESMT